MSQALFLLILFLSFSFAFSDTCGTEPDDNNSTLDECIKMETSNNDACCLLIWEFSGFSGRSCFTLTNKEVTNRDDAYNRLQQDYPGSTGKIFCKGEKEDKEKEENSPVLDTCDTEPYDEDSTLDDCIKMKISSGYNACCLLKWEYKGSTGRSCFSLTKDEVTNRDIAVKRLENKYPGSTGEIVCKEDKEDNSSFLKISLFYLLVLFL